MAEYSSLKVPELKKLLAEKKLPQTGNKADLIARLHEDDKKNAPAADADKPAVKDDEINYTDDDEAAPSAAPEAAPKPAEATGQPTAAPGAMAEATGGAPATEAAGNGAGDDDKTKEETAAAPSQHFSMGLSATAADEEAKKRAERAKRFGMDEDDEAKKRADRAKRFGLDEKELASGLDSALPERPLKRGRGRDGDDGPRGAKRQSQDRRVDRQGRGDRRNGGGGGGGGGGGNRRPGDGRGPVKRGGVLDDPVEREKAAKRAARFAVA